MFGHLKNYSYLCKRNQETNSINNLNNKYYDDGENYRHRVGGES